MWCMETLTLLLALLLLTNNGKALQVVDFTIPFIETGIGIMVNKLNGTVPPFAFLGPYDCLSWTCMLIVAMLSSSVAVLVFEYFSPVGYNGDLTGNKNASRFTLGKSIWLHYGIMVNNSVPIENPRSPSSRYIVSIWAFFCVIFLAMYTANLAAFMIQEENEDIITGLSDKRFTNPTSMHPFFRFGTVPNGSTELNMRTYYPGYHKYMKKHNMKSVGEAIRSLKTRKLDAFLYDYAVLKYAAGKDKDCGLNVIRKPSFTSGYGIVFTKNSKWKQQFDPVLLKLIQNGYIERTKNVWLAGTCGNPFKSRDFTSSRLDVSNMAGLFIMLAGALILSIITFMLEHIFSYYLRPHFMNCSPKSHLFIRTLSRGIYNCLVGEDFKARKARRAAVKTQPMLLMRGKLSTQALLPKVLLSNIPCELSVISSARSDCNENPESFETRVTGCSSEIKKESKKFSKSKQSSSAFNVIRYQERCSALNLDATESPVLGTRHSLQHHTSRRPNACSCSQNLRSNSACKQHIPSWNKPTTPSSSRGVQLVQSNSFGSLRDSVHCRPLCTRLRSFEK